VITDVDVRSSRGSLLNLPLEDVSDGIVVAEIEGLGPVKVSLVSTKFANSRGSFYQNSVSEDRNIKIKFEIHPDWSVNQTVEEVRQKLYAFFMPQSLVKFTFRTDQNLEVEITGRVESCDPAIFVQEPAVDVSIICFDSDFMDPEVVQYPGMTVNDATDFDIVYLGSVPTGVRFELGLDRDLTEFTIYSTMPDGTIRNFDFAAPMLAQDTLIIETTPGAKSIELYRDGSLAASPMYGKSTQSSWIELQPGTNVMRVYADGAPIPYILSYYARYGGL
jgi:hypothetical protein